MADPKDESPFAEFASPKKDAVSDWRERQAKAQASKQMLFRGIRWFFVGASTGTASGLLPLVGLAEMPFALLGSFGGCVIGLAVGVLIGCICYSIMVMSGSSKKPSFESEIAKSDPMGAIKVLALFWGFVGVTLGSAWGSLEGVALGGLVLHDDSAFYQAFIGSLVGSTVMGLVWLVTEKRRRGRDSIALPRG